MPLLQNNTDAFLKVLAVMDPRRTVPVFTSSDCVQKQNMDAVVACLLGLQRLVVRQSRGTGAGGWVSDLGAPRDRPKPSTVRGHRQVPRLRDYVASQRSGSGSIARSGQPAPLDVSPGVASKSKTGVPDPAAPSLGTDSSGELHVSEDSEDGPSLSAVLQEDVDLVGLPWGSPPATLSLRAVGHTRTAPVMPSPAPSLLPAKSEKPLGKGSLVTGSADDTSLDQDREARRQRLYGLATAELRQSEEAYVRDLRVLDRVFRKPFSGEDRDRSTSPLSKADLQTIFQNSAELLALHEEGLLASLKRVGPDQYSAVLSSFADRLLLYQFYAKGYLGATRKLQWLLETSPRVAELVQECTGKPEAGGRDLASYLIAPIQRICRYHLLLREMLKYLDEKDPRHAQLAECLGRMKRVADLVNYSQAVAEQRVEFEEVSVRIGEIIPPDFFTAALLHDPLQRVFLHEGALQYRPGSETSRTRPVRQRDRHYFLFSDCLVECIGHTSVKVPTARGGSTRQHRFFALYELGHPQSWVKASALNPLELSWGVYGGYTIQELASGGASGGPDPPSPAGSSLPPAALSRGAGASGAEPEDRDDAEGGPGVPSATGSLRSSGPRIRLFVLRCPDARTFGAWRNAVIKVRHSDEAPLWLDPVRSGSQGTPTGGAFKEPELLPLRSKDPAATMVQWTTPLQFHWDRSILSSLLVVSHSTSQLIDQLKTLQAEQMVLETRLARLSARLARAQGAETELTQEVEQLRESLRDVLKPKEG